MLPFGSTPDTYPALASPFRAAAARGPSFAFAPGTTGCPPPSPHVSQYLYRILSVLDTAHHGWPTTACSTDLFLLASTSESRFNRTRVTAEQLHLGCALLGIVPTTDHNPVNGQRTGLCACMETCSCRLHRRCRRGVCPARQRRQVRDSERALCRSCARRPDARPPVQGARRPQNRGPHSCDPAGAADGSDAWRCCIPCCFRIWSSAWQCPRKLVSSWHDTTRGSAGLR